MHDHVHPEEERKALCQRVRRVTGQLQGVEKMIADDRDCAEVLTQLVSARRALKSLSEKLIHSHLHHCIEGAQEPGEAKKRLRDLLVVLERYVE
jgi:DNA-binding FrmR family transcriptional regulator